MLSHTPARNQNSLDYTPRYPEIGEQWKHHKIGFFFFNPPVFPMISFRGKDHVLHLS